MTNDYIKKVTPFAKNPLLGYVTEIGADSVTHYSDYHYMADGGTVLTCGGSWSDGVGAGLWSWLGNYSSSLARSVIGGRLCYKPIRN